MARTRGGSGTIRQRSDALWEGRLTVGRGPNGKQRQRSFYAPTRPEVERALETARRNLEMGIEAAGPRLTVDAYLRDWLVSRTGQVAPSTLKRYRGIVEHNIIPAIGHERLIALSGRSVERMLREATEAGLSAQTAGHIRAVLRTALNRALRYGMITRNAAADAYPIPVRRVEHKALQPAQVSALVSGIKGDRLEALYVLALTTGMREGELLGLRWDDIDLDAQTLRVGAQLQRVDGNLILVPTKTAASRRPIPFPNAVAAILRGHRARQNEERFQALDSWHDLGYVFARPTGEPLYAEAVIKAWHALTDRLALPRMTFHDLRGTAATYMHALGAETKVIQATLGHSDSRTTLNLYTHALPEGLKANAERMNVLFESEA